MSMLPGSEFRVPVEQHVLYGGAAGLIYGGAKSFSHQTQLKVRLVCVVVGVELGF